MNRLLVALLLPMAAYAQADPHKESQIAMACTMAAADVALFADDYQKGVPLADEIRKYGNYEFRRGIIWETYREAKLGATSDQMQKALYDSCMSKD